MTSKPNTTYSVRGYFETKTTPRLLEECRKLFLNLTEEYFEESVKHYHNPNDSYSNQSIKSFIRVYESIKDDNAPKIAERSLVIDETQLATKELVHVNKIIATNVVGCVEELFETLGFKLERNYIRKGHFLQSGDLKIFITKMFQKQEFLKATEKPFTELSLIEVVVCSSGRVLYNIDVACSILTRIAFQLKQ